MLSVGQFIFRLQGASHTIYTIHASKDLADWTPVAAYQTADSGQINFLDPGTSQFGYRFYRAVPRLPEAALSLNIPIALDPRKLYPFNLRPNSTDGPGPALGGSFHPSPRCFFIEGALSSLPEAEVQEGIHAVA